jgi:hypothetical protein
LSSDKHDNDRALDEANRAYNDTIWARVLSDEEIAAIYHGAKRKPVVVDTPESIVAFVVILGLAIVALTLAALWVLA